MIESQSISYAEFSNNDDLIFKKKKSLHFATTFPYIKIFFTIELLLLVLEKGEFCLRNRIMILKQIDSKMFDCGLFILNMNKLRKF